VENGYLLVVLSVGNMMISTYDDMDVGLGCGNGFLEISFGGDLAVFYELEYI